MNPVTVVIDFIEDLTDTITKIFSVYDIKIAVHT